MSSPSTSSPAATSSDSSSPTTAQAHGLTFAGQRRSRHKRRDPSRPSFVWRKRDLQTSRLYNLQLDIIDLKHQIQHLTTTRQLLVSKSLNRHDDLDGSSVKAVVEYFRVFQRGLMQSPVDAEAFVRHVMAENIVINNFTGRGLVIDQWKTHSLCFSDIDFRVTDVIVLPLTTTQAVVKCTARFSAAITCRTLALMFPHVLRLDHIVPKLVGRRLEGDGRYDFVFDCRKQQFVRCEVVMDLLGVFARLLPNPRELALLFNSALITDEFYIGEIEHDDRATHVDYQQGAETEIDPEKAEAVDENQSDGSPVSPEALHDKMRLKHILV